MIDDGLEVVSKEIVSCRWVVLDVSSSDLELWLSVETLLEPPT